MSKSYSSAILATFVLVLAIGADASAQCFSPGDDGFDIGCCVAGVIPTLPSFQQTTMTANWAEMSKCIPSNLNVVNVTFTAPVMVYCDYALINVAVTFPGGETISGGLAAKYVRTFNILPIGNGQVWRFLLNGDLTATPTAASTPCTTPLPRCSFVAGQPVHFDGHIDYRCNPGTTLSGVAAFSLTHHSGCVAHAGFSCIPMPVGVLSHNESSYHLVGPAPFTFGVAGPPPVGPLVADAVRTSYLTFVPSFTYLCNSEQKVGPPGNITAAFPLNGCFPANCNPVGCSTAACTAANTCYEDVSLTYQTCCVGAIWGPYSTVPFAGTPVAATGMFAIRLGTWGAFPSYPSGVTLRTYWGVMTHTPPTTCLPLNSGIHLATGIATSNMLAVPFNLAPTCLPPIPSSTTFLDLQNNLPLSTAPALGPGYGCLAGSDVVWSFNTP